MKKSIFARASDIFKMFFIMIMFFVIIHVLWFASFLIWPCMPGDGPVECSRSSQ